MKIFNLVQTWFNDDYVTEDDMFATRVNGFSVGNCLGTFLYESAASDCMKNAVDTIQSECKNAKVSKLGETYRIDFGDGTNVNLHIEIANLVVSEKESLETDYMGVINYISNKIPDELREEIFLHGVIENCCDGQYQTIYFNCDKVKYNDELHIEWVANFRDNRDNDFLIVGRSDGERFDFDELRLEQQLSVVDFVNENFITKPLN